MSSLNLWYIVKCSVNKDYLWNHFVKFEKDHSMTMNPQSKVYGYMLNICITNDRWNSFCLFPSCSVMISIVIGSNLTRRHMIKPHVQLSSNIILPFYAAIFILPPTEVALFAQQCKSCFDFGEENHDYLFHASMHINHIIRT